MGKFDARVQCVDVLRITEFMGLFCYLILLLNFYVFNFKYVHFLNVCVTLIDDSMSISQLCVLKNNRTRSFKLVDR